MIYFDHMQNIEGKYLLFGEHQVADTRKPLEVLKKQLQDAIDDQIRRGYLSNKPVVSINHNDLRVLFESDKIPEGAESLIESLFNSLPSIVIQTISQG